MLHKPTLLVLIGKSGSGKTILEKNLLSFIPNSQKLRKVTTRPRRELEPADSYLFLTEEKYHSRFNNLTVRTQTKGPKGETYWYGSIYPEQSIRDFSKRHYTYTVVANAAGLRDLLQDSYMTNLFSIKILYVTSTPGAIREGRGEQVLEDEANQLDMAVHAFKTYLRVRGYNADDHVYYLDTLKTEPGGKYFFGLFTHPEKVYYKSVDELKEELAQFINQ